MWRLAALAIAAMATADIEADRAGNRVVAFAPQPGAEGEQPGTIHCTDDRRVCARLRLGEGQSQWWLEASVDGGRAWQGADLAMDYDMTRFAIRGRAVRQADGPLLVEVERANAAGYSGGGASETVLVVLRIDPDGAVAPMFEAPVAANKLIRACFSQRDERRRRGACHDEYEFTATLALDPANASGPPRFVLTTRARTYPGQRQLDSDATTQPPLLARDLVWWTDPLCSYRRVFAADAAAEGYLPDAPLPECADYFGL